MTNVLDVVAYILERQGGMTTWKLQKLAYYCQAWSLVWDDDVLFPKEIEAWANGPVVRELYNTHKGMYRVSCMRNGNPGSLSKTQCVTVDAVLTFYGDRSPQWLSDLTHMEKPWQLARRGIPDGERGNQIIPKESLAEYYGSL